MQKSVSEQLYQQTFTVLLLVYFSLNTTHCTIKEAFLLVPLFTIFCEYINSETKFTLVININILAQVSIAKLG